MRREHIEKIGCRYRIGSLPLLFFSTPFIVWQMGVLYFSGTTMSLFGRTPILLTLESTAPVIAAGYLCSVLFLCFFPRQAVWAQRLAMPAALAAAVGLLFPLAPRAATALFAAEAFFCVFSIGTMACAAAQQFTVETTWRDGILSMAVGGVGIAVLQNELFPVRFTDFAVLCVLLIAAQTAFYYFIPAKIEAPYAGRSHEASMPKILFAGVWLISGFATLLLCFASSYAESVPGGVSVLYLSGSVMAMLLFLLRKRFPAGSVRVFGGFLAISAFGFVLAFLSIQLPALQMTACILLGFVVALANLWVFFAAAAFQIYPTRFIGAIGAAMGLALAAFHSALQSALREDIAVLYGIYAALSVALLLLYFFWEPYFIRRWDREKLREASVHAAPERTPAPRAHPFDMLTEQERILTGLILDGYTETSAAREMHISVNTQKSYRKNIYAKLDIHSKRELFEKAGKQ